MAFRLLFLSIFVFVVSVTIWILTNDSLSEEHKFIHQDSFAAPGFENVKKVFEALLANGHLRGASFAAYLNGSLVLNLVGGVADLGAARPWTPDTLTVTMSVSKAVAGLCVALLVHRGLLKYDDPVSKHWPEFGKNGKERVSVDMLVSHRGGMSNLDGKPPLSFEEIAANAPRVAELMEKRAPSANELVYEHTLPGFYHAVTYGLVLDQLVRRVDPLRRSLAEFFLAEIATPLKLDIHPYIPKKMFHRMAHVEPPPNAMLSLAHAIRGRYPLGTLLSLQAFMLVQRFVSDQSSYNASDSGVAVEIPTDLNNADALEVPNLSYSISSGARELARLFHVLALGGELNGVRLFSANFIDKSVAIPRSAFGSFFDLKVAFGRVGSIIVQGEKEQMFGGLGFGGQEVIVDRRRRLSYSYLTNHLSPLYVYDPPCRELADALFRAVDALQPAGQSARTPPPPPSPAPQTQTTVAKHTEAKPAAPRAEPEPPKHTQTSSQPTKSAAEEPKPAPKRELKSPEEKPQPKVEVKQPEKVPAVEPTPAPKSELKPPEEKPQPKVEVKEPEKVPAVEPTPAPKPELKPPEEKPQSKSDYKPASLPMVDADSEAHADSESEDADD